MTTVTPDTLNSLAEFDCPFRVNVNGTVDTLVPNLYAPTLIDDELDDDRWSFIDGYSGQHAYSGPIMHNSEFLGGGMARAVLAEPGVYCAVAAHWSALDEEDDDVEGWALVRWGRLNR